VRFADARRVHKVVRRLSSVSPEELANIWFESEDFHEFYDEIMKAVDKFEQGKTFRDKKCTATGLRHFTEEGQAMIGAMREDVYDAVMYEQDYQYQTDRRDSFLLADVYHQVSADAQHQAVSRARQVRSDVVPPYLICNDSARNKKKRQRKKNQKTPPSDEK
jgi:hypothetical protein